MNSRTKQILDNTLSRFEQIEENKNNTRATQPKEQIRNYLYSHKTSLFPVHISMDLGLRPPTVRRCLAELLQAKQCFKDSDLKYGITKRNMNTYTKALKESIELERIQVEKILSPHRY